MKKSIASSAYFHISDEVSSALEKGQAVVALESTIIAHGMPYPKNIETAQEVEQLVRSAGAVPATIAILNGKICVGLDQSRLESLGKKQNIWKVSLRDLPFVVSGKLDGATTVAATMRIAKIAGIRFFVTGGIGGVHRQAQNTMDISADLTEMSKTNVALISAGVKSILDIGLTLEVLETLGIPVLTFGQDEFPSFYSRKSAHATPLRLDSEKEIASMIKTKWDLGLKGSVLIANPVPAEYEIPYEMIETQIQEALNLSEKEGITGKNITPYLLKKMASLTDGKSLSANIALIKNNASLGARIAVEFSKIPLG